MPCPTLVHFRTERNARSSKTKLTDFTKIEVGVRKLGECYPYQENTPHEGTEATLRLTFPIKENMSTRGRDPGIMKRVADIIGRRLDAADLKSVLREIDGASRGTKSVERIVVETE